ncbi:MAG: hypothetical protein HND55_00005 [Pseudomonadota bacterium]|nr:MAG: hypothetical protein HND55_00005 [Pseudomonadota bacterium]
MASSGDALAQRLPGLEVGRLANFRLGRLHLPIALGNGILLGLFDELITALTGLFVDFACFTARLANDLLGGLSVGLVRSACSASSECARPSAILRRRLPWPGQRQARRPIVTSTSTQEGADPQPIRCLARLSIAFPCSYPRLV